MTDSIKDSIKYLEAWITCENIDDQVERHIRKLIAECNAKDVEMAEKQLAFEEEVLQSMNEFAESLKSTTPANARMISIEVIRRWVEDPTTQFLSLRHRLHLAGVVSMAQQCHDRDIYHAQGSLAGAKIDKGHEEKPKDARFSDRYHYTLGQLEKAREFLDHGRAAAAMDALHRAMDGIIEE